MYVLVPVRVYAHVHVHRDTHAHVFRAAYPRFERAEKILSAKERREKGRRRRRRRRHLAWLCVGRVAAAVNTLCRR